MGLELFAQFYLDKEKDIIVDLYLEIPAIGREAESPEMHYILRTPNHGTGNLITNLAALCGLPISYDEQGLKIIRGRVPCYINADNREVYILRLRDTKVANIFPDGTIERKASIPAISKTLMSQTKDYHLDFARTVVKTWIPRSCKFRTDLHTHMNANLEPDILIALGLCHHIAYPLYYIRKLGLRVNARQQALLDARRREAEAALDGSTLTGKYRARRIDDHTLIDFADLLLGNPGDAAWNIPRIRASLAIMKDGQAVFTNLEKVYLYRYVFTRGQQLEDGWPLDGADALPDPDIAAAVRQMRLDDSDPRFAGNTLFQDKLLWIARGYARRGIRYAEISDTALADPARAPETLRQIHEVMPHVTAETGVMLRFLAAIRRTPLTIVRDRIEAEDAMRRSLEAVRAAAADPWVAGSDIVGEEINDIRDLSPLLRELARIAAEEESFVIRVHAGENDSLRDNVYNSVRCVADSLAPGQPMPRMRIGHGLYTANLGGRKGGQLMALLREKHVVLEFQITSNVRLNNLSALEHHPLRQYLRAGIRCVQGTDGGALYGTDSVDEQLALVKLLSLTEAEQRQMCAAEQQIIREGEAAFAAKTAAFDALRAGRPVDEVIRERIAMQQSAGLVLPGERRRDSADALRNQVAELPPDGWPVIVVGGSFNNDRHITRLHPGDSELLDELLERLDPQKVFLVIGHRLCGQEKYLLDRAREKGFRVWAFVPLRMTAAEAKRVRGSGAAVRVSIEPSGLGVYKSFAYEIFKRRESILLAFDGNSAGCNMIQEARNARRRGPILVSAHARMLRAKAEGLEGYARLFRSPEEALDELRRSGADIWLDGGQPGTTEKD